MTNAADAPTIVERLAEAMALGIDSTEVAASAQGPTFALLEEHPAPWSCREEAGAQTDDARRRHVVRDAHGAVVAECVKFSKHEEEQLASAIASIPSRDAEIERLRGEATQHVAAIDRLRSHGAGKQAEIQKLFDENRNLDAACMTEHRENDRLRTLLAELCEVLLKTSPGHTARGGDARVVVAAKLLVEADINFSDLVLVLARTVLDATASEATPCCAVGIQLDGGAA
jgi:hypothetical protein